MGSTHPPTVYNIEKEYYKQDWHGYYEAIMPLIPVRSAVLDIGCGRGNLMRELENKLGCKVEGVDISEEAVLACVARGLTAIRIDVETEEIPGHYDVIILCAVLEHLRDPVRVLLNIHRNLDVGGHVIVGVPNFSHLAARISYLLGKNAKVFGDSESDLALGLQPYDHIQFFNKASLMHLLKKTGFKPLERSYYSSPYVLRGQGNILRRVLNWVVRLPYSRINHEVFSYFIAIKAVKT